MVQGKRLFGQLLGDELMTIIPFELPPFRGGDGKSMDSVRFVDFEVKVTKPEVASIIDDARNQILGPPSDESQVLVLLATLPSQDLNDTVVIPLGKLFANGSVLLDKPVPKGSYWQSGSKRLFQNGTLEEITTPSGIAASVQTKLTLGTVNRFGFVHEIPHVDLEVLNELNIG